MNSLLHYLALFVALKTPYPYILALCLAFGILLFLLMFVKLKNGVVSYIALVLSLLLFFGCLHTINRVFNPRDDSLDNVTVSVKSVSGKGLLLETGDIVIPVGVEFYHWPGRKYRAMIEEINAVINNKPVTLKYVQLRHGYEVITSSGVNLGEHLVSGGFVRTSDSASDNLKLLEEEAGIKHTGIWSTMDPNASANPLTVALCVFVKELSFVIGIGCVVVVLTLIARPVVAKYEQEQIAKERTVSAERLGRVMNSLTDRIIND